MLLVLAPFDLLTGATNRRPSRCNAPITPKMAAAGWWVEH